MNVDMTHAINALRELVVAHLNEEQARPVRSPQTPQRLLAELDLSVGEAHAFEDVVNQLRAILACTPSTATPRFFNQLFAGRDGAAVLGDALAVVLNNSMYTYKAAGVQVLIELELVNRMGRLMGFTRPEGVFTPGGSLSNLCAMVVARGEAMPESRDQGMRRVGRVYTSEHSHYSIRKGAGLIGIGRDNVVAIQTDESDRMKPSALRAAIERDLERGYVPLMINATVGTTVLGAFDDVDAIADVADAFAVWLHVDAAFGGSMIFHPELKRHLRSVGRANSLTWDPHKLMGVPLTCSVFIVRQMGLLTKHMDERATYLFQDDSINLNPGTRSPQCGRRNNGLKLWTAWRTHGDEGYRRRMQVLRDNTLFARDLVVEHDDLTLVREPPSVNLCFLVAGVDVTTLCTLLNEQGRAMVGHAVVDDVAVVRAAFADPSTSTRDIEVFFEEIHVVAGQLRSTR